MRMRAALCVLLALAASAAVHAMEDLPPNSRSPPSETTAPAAADPARQIRPHNWLTPQYDNNHEESEEFHHADWATAVKATQSYLGVKEIKPIVVKKGHEFFRNPLHILQPAAPKAAAPTFVEVETEADPTPPSRTPPTAVQPAPAAPTAPNGKRIIRPVETITPLEKDSEDHPEDETLLNGGEIKPAVYSKYQPPCVGCPERIPQPPKAF